MREPLTLTLFNGTLSLSSGTLSLSNGTLSLSKGRPWSSSLPSGGSTLD